MDPSSPAAEHEIEEISSDSDGSNPPISPARSSSPAHVSSPVKPSFGVSVPPEAVNGIPVDVDGKSLSQPKSGENVAVKRKLFQLEDNDSEMLSSLTPSSGSGAFILLILARYGNFDYQHHEEGGVYKSSGASHLNLDVTDSAGMQLATITMSGLTASKHSHLLKPGTWIYVQNFSVVPSNPRYHHGNHRYAISLSQTSFVCPYLLPRSVLVDVTPAESVSPLSAFAMHATRKVFGTIAAVIAGVGSSMNGDNKFVIVDEADSEQDFELLFLPDRQDVFDMLRASFAAGEPPIRVFHNIEGTSSPGVFRFGPCAIQYQIPELHSWTDIRDNLKCISKMYTKTFEGILGSFQATNTRQISTIRHCVVCKASNIKVTSRTSAFCNHCRQERHFFSSIQIFGKIHTGDRTSYHAVVEGSCADQVYGLTPGRLLQMFTSPSDGKIIAFQKLKNDRHVNL